ncbi:MAG: cobyric acid synthase [Peptostreptococcaceae bacterium]|nr:cobyric acid synthase [Peptostreptococcaceae bacterium]
MAKAIMVQGTMSDAGKSIITAGLCRIFKQDGYKVAPFKSQNMALNSFITKNGLEMGRAQVVQAEASGIEPDVRMNPILLKPTNDKGSQVIVNGEVIGNIGAQNYYKFKKKLRKDVEKAYAELSAEYDVIVIEGAGSPAEINLNDDDFVNMGMAKIANAPVLLVGDIDRGGVFASLYGTVKLLTEADQDRIKGLVINKFRGDLEILKPGLKQIEDIIEKPILGVVPFLDVDIEDEDSLSTRLKDNDMVKLIDIAVIYIPRIANFTDFNALERFEFTSVRYVRRASDLGNPDLIIIPGTKNTMADLLWMRQGGLEAKILKMNSNGTPVIGICGGYQMMGKTISDPEGLEHGGELRGMGLLNTSTVFEKQKTRTRVNGTVNKISGYFEKLSGAKFIGYEIHNGESDNEGTELLELDNKVKDGSYNGKSLGCYIHGIFDEGDFSEKLMDILLAEKGVDKETTLNMTFAEYKEKQYDLLAAGLRENLDMDKIYEILNEVV